MDKHKRELTKLARQHDAHIDRCGSGHYAIVGKDWCVIASASPSDRMAIKNVVRDLNRYTRSGK